MDSAYIRALEKRAAWLKWAKEQGRARWSELDKVAEHKDSYWATNALPSYISTLEFGDTFFMNKKFASLVEHARETVPDDLEFDSSWMQAKQGWLWIEEPFKVPDVDAEENPELKAALIEKELVIKVSAIGWRTVPEGEQTARFMNRKVLGRVAGPGAVQFLCFQDFSLYHSDVIGFGSWSYFMLQDGDKLIDRIRQFENVVKDEGEGGAYRKDRTSDMMHEIRWVYAAFYLMAQRLASQVQHNTDRNTRRRAELIRQPVTPFIRVVTLRRMEEERKKQAAGPPVDWAWQWEVRGHWRNQFLPSTGGHKPVFVEAYIKGPDDKPLKPPGHKLFVAGR